MNILLLEDNTVDADLTQRGLTAAVPECSIDCVQTLKQARILLKNVESYDIALLDMKLPDGSGLELLMEIRLMNLNMAVIMLTGSGNEEIAVAALKAGADDYVVKREEYISRLPQVIDSAIKRFNQSQRIKSQLIDVLYIEYHQLDIELTERHIKRYAPYIHLQTVSTAEDALKKIGNSEPASFPYQVILIDYRLPGINALEFIKIIRQEYKLDIPIILVTGQGTEEVAIEALKLGANDYLTKTKNYYFRLPSIITSVYQQTELIKKQTELEISESKYRLLAENSDDVIFVLDKDLNYTYISPSVKTLRGYEPQEALKLKLNEVLTPDSYPKAVKIYTEILSCTRDIPAIPKMIELEMIRKDKTTVWTEVKASLMFDNCDLPIGILGVSRDIAKRHSAMVELRKLSRAVEQSPATLIITDTEGKIEYVNPRFTELTGYTFNEAKGKTPRFLSSGTTAASEYEILWKTIRSGEEWRGEFYNKRKDGSLFWESASISPITSDEGEITHFLAIKEDITEKKKNEQELIMAKEKAEESDRLKSAFLANMSHEIRTPMNGILGFAEVLKEPDLTIKQQKEYLGIIEKSGNRMLNIINDIVDISKIESGQMKVSVSETDVNNQLEFIYTLFKPEVEQKGIKMTIKNSMPATEAIIWTDREKLYAILMNLVKNAIKYTMEGVIEFGCGSTSSQSGQPELEFYVKDTGIGIPKQRQEAIFERFIQADIVDKMARQGAGLGLAISKAYVEMLGGKIWVESEEGKGSRFYFTIPNLSAAKEENGSKNEVFIQVEVPKLIKLKILIVEDDLSSSQLISIGILKLAAEIMQVQTGTEAVEACRNHRDIDLILMDIQLPEMDGYEATRQIRKFNKKVIIIAQTAYALSGDKEKALEAGCNDYISKPIKKDKLVEIIRKYF